MDGLSERASASVRRQSLGFVFQSLGLVPLLTAEENVMVALRLLNTGGEKARIGILTSGKTYADTRQALDMLGLDEARCNAIGMRLYKVAMTWPLEPFGLQRFAA